MILPGRELGTNLQLLFLLPDVSSISRTMASFVQITPKKVHGYHKRQDGYTASRRAGTVHYCITVSFNVLPAQRVKRTGIENSSQGLFLARARRY